MTQPRSRLKACHSRYQASDQPVKVQLITFAHILKDGKRSVNTTANTNRERDTSITLRYVDTMSLKSHVAKHTKPDVQ